nr:MAG TPA: hypothetical protein [Caudoviricetes sp.]
MFENRCCKAFHFTCRFGSVPTHSRVNFTYINLTSTIFLLLVQPYGICFH